MQGVVVGEDRLSAMGPVVTYSFTSPSGSTSTQMVCGTCHTRLWNVNTARPGILLVRAGTLDASDTLTPRAHIWAKRKQPWVVIADGVPTYPEGAPPAEFAAILMA